MARSVLSVPQFHDEDAAYAALFGGVDASAPTLFAFRRCGRSSGVPGPACG